MHPKLRRAGSPWRLLVREAGRKSTPHHITNRPSFVGTTSSAGHGETHLLEGTEFDELAVGRWLHIEQMERGRWWMNAGGVTINIEVDRDGRPRAVSVLGPGDFGEAVAECSYQLTWSGPTSTTLTTAVHEDPTKG